MMLKTDMINFFKWIFIPIYSFLRQKLTKLVIFQVSSYKKYYPLSLGIGELVTAMNMVSKNKKLVFFLCIPSLLKLSHYLISKP